jgi:mannose-6-phosphate isomerase-like protein (cupin superfamily)
MPARFAEIGDLHATIDDNVFDISPLLEWAARDEAAGAETPDCRRTLTRSRASLQSSAWPFPSTSPRSSRSSRHWAPKVVARLNDYEIKLAKLKGEFVWHTHDDTDELFLVIDGLLTIQLRDGDVTSDPVSCSSFPAVSSTARSPTATVAVLLIEPAGVVNTGAAGGELTAPYRRLLLG